MTETSRNPERSGAQQATGSFLMGNAWQENKCAPLEKGDTGDTNLHWTFPEARRKLGPRGAFSKAYVKGKHMGFGDKAREHSGAFAEQVTPTWLPPA